MSDTLKGLIARHGAGEREISTANHTLRLADFATFSPFGAERRRFAGRSVVLAVQDMAKAAAALIDLDGLAARLFLAPPGFAPEHLTLAAQRLEADALIYEGEAPYAAPLTAQVELPMRPRGDDDAPPRVTEWVLPTSGTSGPPKLAVHTLQTLTGALGPVPTRNGRRSTTSAVTAACRFFCARWRARVRCAWPARTSRWTRFSTASARSTSPMSPARPPTGARR